MRSVPFNAAAESPATERPWKWVTFIEVIAAALVVVDIAILFAGVVARYIFNRPIIWSDELASALFLWLGMLGAVLALYRQEHLRLTTFLKYFRERTRSLAEAVTGLVILGFVLVLLPPAYTYIQDQWIITTPGLQTADSYRVASIFVGCILMCGIAINFILRRSTIRDTLLAFCGLMIVVSLSWLVRPAIIGMGNYNLPIFFVALVGCLVIIGIPIAFSFGVSTVAYLLLATDAPLFIVVNQMDHGMSSLVLLAIPLFIFLGLLIDITGMAAALVTFLAALIGHVRGGLSYVLLAAMYLVSGISGAKAADMAAIAPILLPEMKRRGYKEGETVALLASSSAMSETIPPSLILITIGSVTGVSISALFTGGLLPAAVGAAALGIMAYLRAGREDRTSLVRVRGRALWGMFLVALPALILPVVIRYAVVEGVATATEVSTVGVVYTLLISPLVYRNIRWNRLYPIIVETAVLSGAILLIIGTATTMGWALTQSGFANQLLKIVTGLPGGAFTFMLVSVVLFCLLGSLLEGIPAIVLFGPLLFPAAQALGIDQIHYSMVVILAMGVGLFSPPFGIGFYISCAIGRVPPEEAMWRVWPYHGALMVALILVAAIPWISIGFL